MPPPLISVIMASFNHADYICAAVDSVCRQEGVEWELLIADDASTDHTLEVLKTFENDNRIRVFSFENNRQYHMRNFAAKHARGDYIAFLNSDDLYSPGKLLKQIEVLQNRPHVAVVFTHVRAVDSSGRQLDGHVTEEIFNAENRTRQQWLWRFFMSGNCLCLSSSMMRRDWFAEVGGFNPQLIQIADLDLWIKTCFKKEMYVIPERLTGVRVLSGNLSASGPASDSRTYIETQQVFASYFSPPGLQQATDIFPEVMGGVAADSSERRAYLLSRTAAIQQSKAMRFFGLTQQHALFKDEKAKSRLQQNNPRLLRTFFLSEGCSGVGQSTPDVNWALFLAPSDGEQDISPLQSCWSGSPGKNVICFSFKNPQCSTRLHLTVESSRILFNCCRIGFYSQHTGEHIGDSLLPPHPVRNKQDFRIPEIDFGVCPSSWVEVEIECMPLSPCRLIYREIVLKCRSLAGKILRAIVRLSQRFIRTNS